MNQVIDANRFPGFKWKIPTKFSIEMIKALKGVCFQSEVIKGIHCYIIW